MSKTIKLIIMLLVAYPVFAADSTFEKGMHAKSKDKKTACSLFETASDNGNIDAYIELAECYVWGYGGYKKDKTKGISMLNNAIKKGSIYAIYRRAIILYPYGGRSILESTKSMEDIRKAAELGLPVAQSHLGHIYRYGSHGPLNIPVNPFKAMFWYRKAAEQGDARSYNSIGRMYEVGAGVKQDLSAAKNWYGKACDAGIQGLENQLSMGGCAGYQILNEKGY